MGSGSGVTQPLPLCPSGLQVVLYIDEADYNPFLVTSTGAKIIVHDQDEYPFIEDIGTEIETAAATSIGMHFVSVPNLGSRCTALFPRNRCKCELRRCPNIATAGEAAGTLSVQLKCPQENPESAFLSKVLLSAGQRSGLHKATSPGDLLCPSFSPSLWLSRVFVVVFTAELTGTVLGNQTPNLAAGSAEAERGGSSLLWGQVRGMTKSPQSGGCTSCLIWFLAIPAAK